MDISLRYRRTVIGPALVLASEDVDLIKSTCNRAILLEEGRIAAAGTAEEILGRYLAATAEVQR
ncbi:ABC-type polysaccharide/polyol phosphate transport system ATPase subunit [Bradyrhizobium sp. LM2.7]